MFDVGLKQKNWKCTYRRIFGCYIQNVSTFIHNWNQARQKICISIELDHWLWLQIWIKLVLREEYKSCQWGVNPLHTRLHSELKILENLKNLLSNLCSSRSYNGAYLTMHMCVEHCPSMYMCFLEERVRVCKCVWVHLSLLWTSAKESWHSQSKAHTFPPYDKPESLEL